MLTLFSDSRLKPNNGVAIGITALKGGVNKKLTSSELTPSLRAYRKLTIKQLNSVL